MSTYLKNMGGYKHNQLKSKSYEEIQKLNNEMRRVNTFIPMDSEEVKSKKETEESSKGTEDELKSDKSKKSESSEEKAKGSRKKMLGRKRAGKEQQQESSKKQRMEDDKEIDEVEEVEEVDEARVKTHFWQPKESIKDWDQHWWFVENGEEEKVSIEGRRGVYEEGRRNIRIERVVEEEGVVSEECGRQRKERCEAQQKFREEWRRSKERSREGEREKEERINSQEGKEEDSREGYSKRVGQLIEMRKDGVREEGTGVEEGGVVFLSILKLERGLGG
ncbi:hypothetical protein Tco_0747432 [Tanacetum coccineum]|uniref:Uncharacterized protein n=1 Tax=Tanacetum coccineum TaxID=301880 RepID=A0ABQ4YTX5_9ASTR